MVSFPLIDVSNYTEILSYGMGEYNTFFPTDIFFGIIFTVIAIGMFISTDGSLKTTFGFLLLADLFFSAILFSPILFGYAIIAAIIGAYIMYSSYFEG